MDVEKRFPWRKESFETRVEMKAFTSLLILFVYNKYTLYTWYASSISMQDGAYIQAL